MNDADHRQSSPSAARNRGPILDILKGELAANRHLLEVGSGTGEHAVHMARHLPDLIWQASDLSDDRLHSIAAWRDAEGGENLPPPLRLDVHDNPWPIERAGVIPPIDAIMSINMIHIAPWSACQALMAGAARILQGGGKFILYGPFRRDGEHTAPSNDAFDKRLRGEDESWGVREMERVIEEAAMNGLAMASVHPMPANNFILVFHQN